MYCSVRVYWAVWLYSKGVQCSMGIRYGLLCSIDVHYGFTVQYGCTVWCTVHYRCTVWCTVQYGHSVWVYCAVWMYSIGVLCSMSVQYGYTDVQYVWCTVQYWCTVWCTVRYRCIVWVYCVAWVYSNTNNNNTGVFLLRRLHRNESVRVANKLWPEVH